jgi:hypothetical protein
VFSFNLNFVPKISLLGQPGGEKIFPQSGSTAADAISISLKTKKSRGRVGILEKIFSPSGITGFYLFLAMQMH